jgi:hypothetical protein
MQIMDTFRTLLTEVSVVSGQRANNVPLQHDIFNSKIILLYVAIFSGSSPNSVPSDVTSWASSSLKKRTNKMQCLYLW